jgi:hypothetical protein
MAKRKQDPEELPDAPEIKGKGKKKDDDSDSDEVWRIFYSHARNGTHVKSGHLEHRY